uniref:Uncharacterized protein n=1 Tax=viral metagenome TaxID=1070528 RepID=A0A6C0JTX5_9ZZZZ
MIVVLDCPYHNNSNVLGMFTDWETCLDYFEKINPNPNKETWLWGPESNINGKFDYFPREYIIQKSPKRCCLSFWGRRDENHYNEIVEELGFVLFYLEHNTTDLDAYFDEKYKEAEPEAYKFRIDGPAYNENIL